MRSRASTAWPAYRHRRRLLPLAEIGRIAAGWLDRHLRPAPRAAVNLRFRYRHDAREAQAFCRDLTARGVFLKTDDRPRLDTRVALSFVLPGEEQPIHCAGKVLRTSDGRTREEAGFAVALDEMALEDRERLTRFVARIARRRLLRSWADALVRPADRE